MIDFLNELGNFKQKNFFYTFDFHIFDFYILKCQSKATQSKYKTYNMLLYTNDGHENVMLSLSEFYSITLCCYAFVRK